MDGRMDGWNKAGKWRSRWHRAYTGKDKGSARLHLVTEANLSLWLRFSKAHMTRVFPPISQGHWEKFRSFFFSPSRIFVKAPLPYRRYTISIHSFPNSKPKATNKLPLRKKREKKKRGRILFSQIRPKLEPRRREWPHGGFSTSEKWEFASFLVTNKGYNYSLNVCV